MSSHLGTPLDEASTFIRNTIAGSPQFGDKFECIGIDTDLDYFANPQKSGLFLHLNDGTTIHLLITREPRGVERPITHSDWKIAEDAAEALTDAD